MFLPVADVADRRPLGARRRAAPAATCSTATGWSSRSGGPARSTGRSPTARGAATEVWTTWLPVCETPQTAAEEIDGALLDMTRLAEASERRRCEPGLRPIVERYADWLDGAGSAGRDPAGAPAGRRPRRRSPRPGRCSEQLADGLEHLLRRCGGAALLPVHEPGDGRPAHPHPDRGAAQQATRSCPSSCGARAGARQTGRGRTPGAPFQLAFILMQLPLLTDPAAAAPQRRPGQGRAAVLPDRWRQDRGLPRPGGVHVRRSAAGRASSTPPTGRSTGAPGWPC